MQETATSLGKPSKSRIYSVEKIIWHTDNLDFLCDYVVDGKNCRLKVGYPQECPIELGKLQQTKNCPPPKQGTVSFNQVTPNHLEWTGLEIEPDTRYKVPSSTKGVLNGNVPIVEYSSPSKTAVARMKVGSKGYTSMLLVRLRVL
eukprot:Nk52_evm1s1539 gene=Nk52_evmTU1s1539